MDQTQMWVWAGLAILATPAVEAAVWRRASRAGRTILVVMGGGQAVTVALLLAGAPWWVLCCAATLTVTVGVAVALTHLWRTAIPSPVRAPQVTVAVLPARSLPILEPRRPRVDPWMRAGGVR